MKIVVMLFFALISIWESDSHAENLKIFTEEWKPVSFSNNGNPDGLGVNVVQEILKRLKMNNSIQIVPWARGWKMITEKPNVVLFTMTRTDEREKMFAMIGPVAVGTTNFYAKKGSNIKIEKLDDARKFQKIGVYRSAVEEQILNKHGFTNIDPTSLPLHSAKKLMMGRINLWCNANLTAGKLLEEAGFSINDVENVFTIQANHLYIAFSKGTSKTLVNRWKDALEKIKKDGTFGKIYNKWLPGEVPPETTELIGTLQ